MKKFLIVVLSSILVVFFSVSSIAYADEVPTPVYLESVFVTKYGKEVKIKYLQNDDVCSDHPSASNYSSAVKIANGTRKYNCFTYAMIFEGNIDGLNQLDDNKIFNIDSPFYLLGDNPCFESVTFNNIMPGDVVLYYVNDTTLDSKQGHYYSHSGIVYSKGNTINDTVIVSKWGNYAVYRHNITDCPYKGLSYSVASIGDETATVEISFARFAHDYSYRLIRKNSVATSYHLAECADCGVYHVELHEFINQNNRVVCKDCGYNTGIQVNNVEDTE